ncbi:hypothetical protein KGO95_03870 [Patescibacteria group bacterium]|nr:hypothetical protein [Patescibacteria group bacterium]
MKNIIISGLSAALIATGLPVVFAQTTTAVPVVALPAPVAAQGQDAAQQREALRQQIQAQIDALRAQTREQDQAAATATQAEVRGLREQAQAAATATRAEMQNVNEQMRQTMQAEATATPELRAASRLQYQQERSAILDQMKQEHETFLQNVQAARQTLQQKRASEQADLKARLANIKDQAKAATVQQLDQRFTDINQNITSQWVNTLAILSDIVTKISSRADTLESNGADVSAVRTAVTAAQTAIDAARTGVTAQTAKTYPMNVTTDTTLKSVVSQVRDTLNTDLKATRDLLQAAHNMVAAAAQALNAVPGASQPEATTTPATTTQ